MKNIENRKVVWQTAIALIAEGKMVTFIGEVEGEVAEKILGNNGFGFDPIFYIKEKNMTLGQMNFEEKENFSARKRAITKLVKYLEENN